MARGARNKASRRVQAPGETLPPPTPPKQPSPEHVAAICKEHVGIVRSAFFKLASVRAAELVSGGKLTPEEGAAYIVAEMDGLNGQLAAAEIEEEKKP